MSAEFSGALTQRLTLLRRQAARDTLGGASGAWAATGTIWASVVPVASAPWGAGDRPVAAPRWRAMLRSNFDVSPGDRAQWRGLIFAVRAVEADPATPDRIALILEEEL